MYINILERAECNYNCWDIEINYTYMYMHMYILRILDTIWNNFQIIIFHNANRITINRPTFWIFPALSVPDIVRIEAEKC